MKIEYKFGDLFASGAMCVLHGCNASNGFGSGVAAIVKKYHPAACEAYHRAYATTGLRLGEIVWAKSNGIMIGNAITQEKYGRDKSVVYCSYDAIRQVMKTLNALAKDETYYKTVAMPMIGAGLANGDWNIIANIIEEESEYFQPVVYIIDKTIFDDVVNK